LRAENDVLGLAVYRERNGLCLDLLIALSDQMEAEGITENPGELGRRYDAVIAGLRPCPLQANCKRYHDSIANGQGPS